jgi:putative hydrolase of the HAD superfamily
MRTNKIAKTTLFLDIGGVLLTNGWDRKARISAAKFFKLELDDMLERHHLTFDTYEVGKLSLEEYLNRVVFYQKRPFTVNQFKKFMFEQTKPYPQMIDMISRLKQKYKLKVAVVSNEGSEMNEYRIKKYKLGNFIDFFISSCFVHFRKPDPDIYRVAIDIAQVKPEQVIYIEDRPLFIQVAKELGIDGIRHTDYLSTRKQLESLGFKDNERL